MCDQEVESCDCVDEETEVQQPSTNVFSDDDAERCG